ncbi:Kef-type K+ transport system membrane component KefB [Saccharopolyspora lacisalsi]|uniref:Kef-type K+ transport system membrane component KefB n=1 Tax=Halosaccharopolyspora lacisalsi TaxID=1000566 RepID=A0A839DXV7_9PSEU|nr:Kef-type K+ transport system membrane component KefB [Halosaccharopolyspora lacisalsi]
MLLLLLPGLECSASELVTGLRRSWLAGLLDLVLNAAPGALVALLLGWGPLGALAVAGITYISSSGIVAKVLGDSVTGKPRWCCRSRSSRASRWRCTHRS